MIPRRLLQVAAATTLLLTLLGCRGPGGARADQPSPDRARALAAIRSVMGDWPGPEKRCPLEVRVESEDDLGDIVRRRLTYQAEPGDRVTAYLLAPKAALGTRRRRFPGVLALHQTHPAGQKVVVGLVASPDDAYGVELARRGYVVLAPPYPQLADYQPDLRSLGWASGSLKAVWNNVRALDLLSELPCVRTNGFGSIGHSLGGHNGLFTAAFDERIRVVVSSCGFDSFRDYYDGNPEVWQPERGWCQTRYMPRLAGFTGRLDRLPFDFPDVLTAIAPRAVWVSAPLGDDNFRWRSVDRVAAAVAPRFADPSGGSSLVVVHPDGPHRFPPEVRDAAYAFIDRQLGIDPMVGRR